MFSNKTRTLFAIARRGTFIISGKLKKGRGGEGCKINEKGTGGERRRRGGGGSGEREMEKERERGGGEESERQTDIDRHTEEERDRNYRNGSCCFV